MVELILFGSLAVMIFINIPIAIGLGFSQYCYINLCR